MSATFGSESIVMKYVGLVVIVCGLLAGQVFAAAAQTGPQTVVPRFDPVPCPDPVAERSNFECGYLTVPEDHARPDGPAIRLMVGIARSRSADPEPDPVLVLVGGPGNAAVINAGDSGAEHAIRARRDIIYLDQRGTGYSEPNLMCPELSGVFVDDLAYLEAMRACRDRLVADGVDLRAYTSAQSAADVAALRLALGIETWNLWGSSYGTRLALTVLRDHPEGVRSVILDSVYPPNAAPDAESSLIAYEMFTRLFDDCADDPLCNLVYPNLERTYTDLFARLESDPVALTVHDPETGDPVPFTLDGAGLSTGVLQLISDRGMAARLPATLHAFHDGDFGEVEAIVQGLAGDQATNGMAFSVMCSEEIPFDAPTEITAAAETVPAPFRVMQGDNNVWNQTLCQTWLGDVTPDPVENEPVISDVPTLLLAGEYDASTPPRWAHLAASTLERGIVYEFPGVGHIALMGGSCPQGIMLDFLDDPAAPPPAACIDKMRGITFVVTAPATRPWARASAGILGLLAAVAVGIAGRAALRTPRRIAWRNAAQLMGWLFPVFTAGGLVALLALGDLSETDTLRAVEIVVPLAMAIQVVFLFSPDDELPLEVLLACPRRPPWILLERLAVVFAVQSVIALVGALVTLIITGDGDVLLALLRWIPPALMLSGIATYTTIRSRLALFGVAVTLLVWFMLVAMGNALIPGRPTLYPMNYIQPWLWPFQPYFKPGSLAASDYVLNRVTVAAFGLCLIALAARQLRDEESVLLGRSCRRVVARGE